jgi:uncharacterized protein YcfJ
MIKNIHKGMVVTMMLLSLLFVTAAPAAMAQGRDRRYYGSRYDRDHYRDGRYHRRFEREATNGNLIKRTAIGGGVGAVAGALIGGGKGALIGGGAGAAVGYIIHRKKIDDQRDRIRDRFRRRY